MEQEALMSNIYENLKYKIILIVMSTLVGSERAFLVYRRTMIDPHLSEKPLFERYHCWLTRLTMTKFNMIIWGHYMFEPWIPWGSLSKNEYPFSIRIDEIC